MKRAFIPILSMLLLCGCFGYTSKDNVLTGQVKKVQNVTPIVCSDYQQVDISLGVLRNGVGSMSSEDVWLAIDDKANLAILQKAAASGALVKVTYNVQRTAPCWINNVVTAVEITP